MKLVPIRIHLIALFICLSSSAYAVPWKGKSGKTIEADFVRIDGKVIVLKKGKEFHRFTLTNLTPDSQAFAAYLQEERKKWAAENANSALISAQILKEVIAFDRKFTEGKFYVVEGQVSSIINVKSRNKLPGRVYAIMNNGIKVPFNFSHHGRGEGANMKVVVTRKAVMLMNGRGKRTKGGKYTKYAVVAYYLKVGQDIAVRVKVKNGKIVGLGKVSSGELAKAQREYVLQNNGITPEDAANFERLQNRAEYLKAKLSGNAGTATIHDPYNGNHQKIVIDYSAADKASMRKELELIEAQIAGLLKR